MNGGFKEHDGTSIDERTTRDGRQADRDGLVDASEARPVPAPTGPARTREEEFLGMAPTLHWLRQWRL